MKISTVGLVLLACAAGLPVTIDVGLVRIQLCAPDIVRVQAGGGQARTRASLVVTRSWDAAPVAHNLTRSPAATVITTDALRIVVAAGNVSFFGADGAPLLSEQGREFSNDSVSQRWDSPASEALYGLGHFNFGLLDFRLAPVDMSQWNLWKVSPLLVSTRGWGLLWDTSYATGHLNKVTDSEAVQLSAWAVRPASGSDTAPTRAYNDTPAVWSEATGTISVTVPGQHWVYLKLPTLAWCSHAARVTVAGKPVIDLFDDPCNLPPSTLGRIQLAPGRHPIKIETWAQTDNKLEPAVWVRGPQYGNLTSWQSNRPAAGIDYYFLAGGSIGRSIGLYRRVTGSAPMPPRAIFGFMHSKDRFTNQSSLLAAAEGFRKGQFPIDTIVQDWYFWPAVHNSLDNYGFDRSRYPDPAGMTVELKHKHKLHFMVTYWPQVDGPLREALANHSAVVDGVCDQYNPIGRELYYEYANRTKYAIGVDFSWLDSCDCQPNGPNYLGDGADYAMTYGLMETTAIHDGYVRDWGDTRRMFALPRSSFAGMQRTGASMWSGDISGTWDSLRRSVAGSINYQLSGNALWSMDTGGYFHALDELTNPEYRELLVRWHQFASFTPVLRQHGRKGAQSTPGGGSEYYEFGGNVTASIKLTHQLRYRLLPFIYSVFAIQVSTPGGPESTLQRALIMEFPHDPTVRQTADSFMFGPSFLVFPVLQYRATERLCYLPKTESRSNASFVDFWTGEPFAQGLTLRVPLVLDHIPLFVRAGSIVPMGPHLQYAAEKPPEPLELRIYRGADAFFTLYEDDGSTMAYVRRNESSTIDMHWEEATATFHLAARVGSFVGMLSRRTLQVVLVSKGYGVGLEPAAQPTRVVAYDGSAISVRIGSPVVD